jgi:hypothetical protein
MPDPLDLTRRPGLATLAVFVAIIAVSIVKLGDAPLSGTEAHRTIPAHQMLESGEWLTPQLWGQPYLAKPPLHYWTLAAAELAAGGGSEWIWRLPSSLAAGLLGVVVCVFARRWFGSPAALAAGLSYLGLLALWSQARKADIDALHTLAVVAAALCLIELGVGRSRRPLAWMGMAGLAVAGALLLKGPAGAMVMVGAILGPAVFNRDWKPLLRPYIWGAVVLGVVPLAVWMVAVAGSLDGRTPPVVLAVYALPVSAALPLALHPDTGNVIGEQGRRIVRALAGAVIVALVVGLLARIVNPRYMYIMLPLLCPLAGAVGAAWAARGSEGVVQSVGRVLMIAFAVGLSGIAVVLTMIVWLRFDVADVPAVVASVVAVCVGVWTVRAWVLRRDGVGAWGVAVLLLLAALPFASFTNEQRRHRSLYEAGLKLRGTVGAGRQVTAGLCVLVAPELLYYAGVEVDYVGDSLPGSMTFPTDRWILLFGQEWEAWEPRAATALQQVTELPAANHKVVVAFYTAGAP